MLDLCWLEESNIEFPPTSLALQDPNGLLAVGGDLKPERLIEAYKNGIFPWFSEDQPILWWSPSPRTVFIPTQVHCSKSMAKFMRKSHWQVKIDSQFEAVIRACATCRKDGQGTWICDDMIEAYIELHRQGFAHSIEVFDEDELVGGLYGVALGRVFFGESMFSRASNASKLAFITLCRWLDRCGFELIDAQIENNHLISLGADQMCRKDFEKALHLNTSSTLIDSTQNYWQQAQGKTVTREGHLNT